MPPQKKLDLEKLAWSWTESVLPENIERQHLESSYRIGLKNCKTCKRNCSNNPSCLTGLGEDKYIKSHPGEIVPLENSLSELRDPTQYVGLRNLGATCYVNSLIQVWFHNEDMRRIIYKWKISEDPEERESLRHAQDKKLSYVPVTVVGQLQYIFAMMQFGNRRLLDPTNLAIALSLDTGTQQDAQEFSKLLLAHIEGKLQQNIGLKAQLQRLTQGTYIYVNRCSTCSTEYSTSTTFYELDLQLAPTLREAISRYLSEEELTGTNKYHCRNCRDKQDAKRFIRLDSLPDTLNFQLLRFVFHRESGQKKKLTSSIQFPEELDMSEYLSAPSAAQYTLVAVLSHKGPSAHSGHYIVNVCNSSGEWYQFSDDKVEKMPNRRFADDINDGVKPAKRARLTKGCLSSNTAYMLVYKRLPGERARRRMPRLVKEENHATEKVLSDSPPELTECTKRKDSTQDELESPPKRLRSEENCVKTENHAENSSDDDKNINKRLSDCVISRENDGDHQSSKMSEETKDASGKLNNWEKNYQALNGDAHRAMSCEERERYETLEFDKWELSEPLRELVRQENIKYELGLLAVQEEKQKEVKSANTKRQEVIDFYAMEADAEEYAWLPTCWLSRWLGDHAGEGVSSIDNSILLCSHSRMDPGKVTRAKIVPRRAADMLYEKYRGGPMLDQDSLCEPCVRRKCKMLRFKQGVERDHREAMEIIKNDKEAGEDFYIIGAGSLKNWRRLALEQAEISGELDEDRENSQEEEIEKILNFNDDLLCEHDGLRAHDASRKLIPAAAWNILRKYFPAALEYPACAASCIVCEEKVENEQRAKQDDKIKARQQKEELGDLYFGKNRQDIMKIPGEVYYIVGKGFLDAWRSFIRNGGRHPPTDINNSHLLCEEHKGFLYEPEIDSKLYGIVTADEWSKLSEAYTVDYVIKISSVGEDGTGLITVPDACRTCIIERIETERIRSMTYEKATIYIQCTDDTEESESMVKSARSSRLRRKAKSSHELKVSSENTLLELKSMVMAICGALPCDQHLSLDDHELINPRENLGSLGVHPGAVLKLKIDTPQDMDLTTESDSVSPEASSPEKGFKGTELVSS